MNNLNKENKFENIYLFSDIDGTLANLKDNIPERNVEAINYFVENGGTFGVATGRYLGDIDLLNKVPVNGLCILNNGASIYDYNKKELLHSEVLPDDIINFYVNYLNNNQDIGLLIVNDEGYITVDLDNNRPVLDERYIKQNLRDIKLPYYKIMFIIKNKNINQIIEELEELKISSNIKSLEYIDYIQTGEYTLEVVPKDISKGKALAKICNDFNINQSKVFFVGDSFNDVTMMNEASFSACVSHAPDEVKKHANFITCNFEDGAVADIIEYIYNL